MADSRLSAGATTRLMDRYPKLHIISLSRRIAIGGNTGNAPLAGRHEIAVALAGSVLAATGAIATVSTALTRLTVDDPEVELPTAAQFAGFIANVCSNAATLSERSFELLLTIPTAPSEQFAFGHRIFHMRAEPRTAATCDEVNPPPDEPFLVGINEARLAFTEKLAALAGNNTVTNESRPAFAFSELVRSTNATYGGPLSQLIVVGPSVMLCSLQDNPLNIHEQSLLGVPLEQLRLNARWSIVPQLLPHPSGMDTYAG